MLLQFYIFLNFTQFVHNMQKKRRNVLQNISPPCHQTAQSMPLRICHCSVFTFNAPYQEYLYSSVAPSILLIFTADFSSWIGHFCSCECVRLILLSDRRFDPL